MSQARRSPGMIWVQRIVSAAVFGICTASVQAQFLKAPTDGKQIVLPEGGPAPGPRAGCLYQHDDGSQETQVGVNAEMAWMNKFTVHTGCAVIKTVEVAFGGTFVSVPNGSPAKVCVWEDPTDDGDPSDAVLLIAQDVLVANANTGIPATYQLSHPVAVSGVFFVGAWYANGLLYPAGFDEITPGYVPNNTWFVGGSPVNLNNLSSNMLLGTGDSFGVPGYAMIRAQGGSGPFTYQGVLRDQGLPVSGSADFRFTIYDVLAGGVPISPTIESPSTPVTDGTFTARFAADPSIMDGRVLWLEIEARHPAGTGAFTKLTPRQLVTPAMYAEFATSADRAFNAQTADFADTAASAQSLSGTVPWAQVSGKPPIPDGNSLDASDGSPANAVQVDANGFVGINTPAPLGRLHVVDATGGTGSVRLPASAIDASEILDEPGVANLVTSSTLPATNVMTNLASQTITVPGPGFVVAFATLEASLTHTVGTSDSTTFGVSSVPGSFPSFQDVEWFIGAQLPTAQMDIPFTVHGVFSVPSGGAHTFYVVGLKTGGSPVACNDLNLTLMYFPTAYGPVTSNFRGDGGDLEPMRLANGTKPSPGAARTSSVDVLQELEALRQEVAELRSLRDEIKALKAQLQTAPRR